MLAYIALIPIKYDTYQLYHYSLNILQKKPNHKPGKDLQV